MIRKRFFDKLVVWVAVLIFAGLDFSCMDDELGVGGEDVLENIVSLSLPIELEDAQDAADELPATRSVASNGSAFDVHLGTARQARAVNYADALKDARPAMLPTLQILQMKNGAVLSNKTYTNVALGSRVGLTLVPSDDCELVVWVKGGSGDIASTNWNTYEVANSTIKNITTATHITADGRMPYLLHLKHVKVMEKSDVTGEGIIQSVAGEDVRLRLQRLPARLNVTWNYNVAGYTLQSIHLHNFPAKFVVFPSESEETYPSLLSLFTYRIATAEELAAKHLSCWLPRNVRGTRNITLPTKRGKKIAPTGSTYLEFTAVATDVTVAKKKLIYRIYLGGNNTSDFNVRDNTNYWYHIDFNHTNGEEIIRTDDRVEYLNGRSAAEDNNNVVPTANCFMIEPGGAFCFDPYTYRQNGVDIANLVGKQITSVKLLWQIKEDGDVGEPTMGIVNSSSDHTNIVDVCRKNGSVVNISNPLTGRDQGYIYCRVADTRGGSGVIAAYNGNTLIDQWHVWVTDYHPEATGNETILDDENRRKMKYVKGDQSTLPFMDRNLGAQSGFINYPTEIVDKSKAAGFHYLYGNKKPLPSSYSYKTISGKISFNLDDGLPPENILNMYQPDGVSYYARQGVGGAGNWNSALKPLNDPCPAGWRVPSYMDFKPLFEDANPLSGVQNRQYAARGQDVNTLLNNGKGGCALRYDNDAGHFTYYRMTGYQPLNYNYFQNIDTGGNVICREKKYGFTFSTAITDSRFRMFCIGTTWGETDAHTIRCIQEKE